VGTNGRGRLEGTKLCKQCRTRQDKVKGFYDYRLQPEPHAVRLSRTRCRDCIEEMARGGMLTVENGRIQVLKCECSKCGKTVPIDQMGGLYWCRECHGQFSRAWYAGQEAEAKR